MSLTPGRDAHWRAAHLSFSNPWTRRSGPKRGFSGDFAKQIRKQSSSPTAERITVGRYAGAKGSLAPHLRDRKGIAYDFTYDLLLTGTRAPPSTQCDVHRIASSVWNWGQDLVTTKKAWRDRPQAFYSWIRASRRVAAAVNWQVRAGDVAGLIGREKTNDLRDFDRGGDASHWYPGG
jgi:hypothetical protein